LFSLGKGKYRLMGGVLVMKMMVVQELQQTFFNGGHQ